MTAACRLALAYSTLAAAAVCWPRELLTAGFAVHGVDASPAMIELARDYARGADLDVLRLPTRLPPGECTRLSAPPAGVA
jgi:hypothetical protein